MTQDLFSRVAAALIVNAPRAPGIEPHLQAALTQVVAHPGKLLRARLAHTAARRHRLPARRALELACAIEYFHAASLVLDDLPCMDDASLRRGLPCVHRQHGEATAILTALALINRGYALMGTALARQSHRIRAEAGACVERCLGVEGLVGGQAWDLAFATTSRSTRVVGKIAAAKTGALFELAIVVPALPGRPSPAERRLLRALCTYWGQLFQIADDLRDVISSTFTAGKTTGRDRALERPNLALALGVPRARARLARLESQSRRTLAALIRRHSRWNYLRDAAVTLGHAAAPALETQSAAA